MPTLEKAPQRRQQDKGLSAVLKAMYLMSWNEIEGTIEASLGGRVTSEEMHVFVGEVDEVVGSFQGRGFHLCLDYSKAKEFDRESLLTLRSLKDRCLKAGASTIVSIARDEEQMARETSDRLSLILEGRERILLDMPGESEGAGSTSMYDIGYGLAA